MQILNGANIPAISINSKLREEERTAIEKQLQLPEGPAYKFLFLTPEQCATLRTRQLLGTLSTRRVLRAVVIDEAHCISGKSDKDSANVWTVVTLLTLSQLHLAWTFQTKTKMKPTVVAICGLSII